MHPDPAGAIAAAAPSARDLPPAHARTVSAAAFADTASRDTAILTPRVGRVLMTADAVGGVWQYAMTLSAGLRASGVEVMLAVLGPAPREAQRAAAAHVATLVERPWRLEWMEGAWDDVERSAEWLLGLEHSLRPDVVHLNGFCHAALPWRAPALVVAHSCVRSWWRAVHGVEAPADWDRYRDEVSRGLAAARLIVSPTAAMLAALRAEYDGFGEGCVIPNGSAHAEEANRPAAAKEPIVFAAGRAWDEAKNIASLCAVAGELPWPLYLAGDLHAPDGQCVSTGYVRHVGRLDERAMRQWYGRAAIYALPARYEPFGLSILEAASAGCALVLGDLASLRENWSDAAVFVPPDNRRALAAALRRLIEDPELRVSLGERARIRARRFTADRMVAAYLAVYGRLLQAYSSGPDVAHRQVDA